VTPSATTIRTAATAKVLRMPMATAIGGAVARSFVDDASVKTAPMNEAPVISPRLRDRLSRPETNPRWSGARFDSTAVLLAVWKSA